MWGRMQPGEVTQETEGSQKETSSPCQVGRSGGLLAPFPKSRLEKLQRKTGIPGINNNSNKAWEAPGEMAQRRAWPWAISCIHHQTSSWCSQRICAPNRALSLLQKKNSKLHTLLSEEEGLEHEQTDQYLKQDSSKTKQIRQKWY